jgi:DNA modification methylase
VKVLCRDCLDYLGSKESDTSFDVVFADPPDNIGLKYESHEDRMNDLEYIEFLSLFMTRAMAVAKRGLWISFNARHVFKVVSVINQDGDMDWDVTPCVQVITFGNQKNKPGSLTNNYRPLWYISWGKPDFYEVREPSWRQINGDKRANPAGKLVSDVFNFPRVTGNSKQRRAWHPTQLNEKLVERCLLLTTQRGDSVLDIFAGTGTTGRVCRSIGRDCTLIEKSELYCQKMREEFYGQSSCDSGVEESVH